MRNSIFKRFFIAVFVWTSSLIVVVSVGVIFQNLDTSQRESVDIDYKDIDYKFRRLVNKTLKKFLQSVNLISVTAQNPETYSSETIKEVGALVRKRCTNVTDVYQFIDGHSFRQGLGIPLDPSISTVLMLIRHRMKQDLRIVLSNLVKLDAKDGDKTRLLLREIEEALRCIEAAEIVLAKKLMDPYAQKPLDLGTDLLPFMTRLYPTEETLQRAEKSRCSPRTSIESDEGESTP